MEFKNMSFKKKREHIWEYYKLHIFAVIFAIVFVSYIIYDKTHTKEIIGNITILSNQVLDDKRIDLQEEMNKVVVANSKKQQVDIGVYPIESTGENVSQYISKLQVQIATGEIDLIISNKTFYNELLKSEVLLKLDDLEELDFSTIGNKLIKGTTSSGEGTYAINAEGNEYLKTMNIDSRDKVFAIISTSNRKEEATKMLKWFLEQ
ncbi:hypothetical protein [Clostridium cellulovorans]|uniref:Uncharacterized protein n=1 Tax=Clostridium cellulovorans (strain ATCC 35296 / DSM 3052 / OCM 3 / 743B) TaxID=573061 RepID=D9SR80_CLOC7|nr:hypothetical protein [Clostridium cellulovorans]ADL50368.1 hypothetical protein Clocel_0597 [Clostridium cellulovorans 743B]